MPSANAWKKAIYRSYPSLGTIPVVVLGKMMELRRAEEAWKAAQNELMNVLLETDASENWSCGNSAINLSFRGDK